MTGTFSLTLALRTGSCAAVVAANVVLSLVADVRADDRPVPGLSDASPAGLPGVFESEDARDKAVRDVLDIFSDDVRAAKTDAAKVAFAERLIESAGNSEDDRAVQYALLHVARDQAVRAGSLQVSLRAIDLMAAHGHVDAAATKATAIEALRKSISGREEYIELGRAAFKLLPAVINIGEYPAAQRLGDLAESAARRARDTATAGQLARQNRLIGQAARVYRQAESAQETLRSTPDDQEAALTLGRYLAEYRLRWSDALPWLATGSDAELASLASYDQRGAKSPDECLSLGDTWWAFAESQTANSSWQMTLKQRAARWYSQALEGQLPALRRAAVDQRLKAIAEMEHPLAEILPARIAPGDDIPTDRWIELLAWIEPGRFGMDSKWKRTPEGLASPSGGKGKAFDLPVRMADGSEMQYEIAFEATGYEKAGATVLVLPVGAANVNVSNQATLAWVSGQFSRRADPDGFLAVGKRISGAVRVDAAGDGTAGLQATANGDVVREWSGKQSALTSWARPDRRRLTIGGWDSQITYHSIRFRLISGSAKRVGADTAE